VITIPKGCAHRFSVSTNLPPTVALGRCTVLSA
jgi:hypothetical protein